MTSGTLAPMDEMVALRHRVAALEVESSRLRAQLAVRAVDTETVECVATEPPPDGDALLRAVLDAADAEVAVLDRDGRVLFVNERGLAALGAERLGRVSGTDWDALWPPEQAGAVRAALDSAAGTGMLARFHAPRSTSSGAPRWCDATVAPVPDPSGRLVAITRDATERRQALDAKDALLAEKDLLLQEVHHRVKNSVQMVQNLLNLQARSCTDATAAAQLADSAARVHMIGAVHDRLYRSGGTLAVEIRPYLEELVRDLRDGLASAVAGRTVRVEADAVTWPAAQVPPLGLILTELVTNALRYGTGRVDVRFRQDGPPEGLLENFSEGRPRAHHGGNQGWATLTVEDEGTALSPGFEPADSRGLGMRLVLGMLRRKGAGLSIDRTCPHTRFVVRMPAP